MYTLKDVAQMTHMTPRTIQNYLAKGTLKGAKVGGQWRFTEDQVKALFQDPHVTDYLRTEQEAILSDRALKTTIPPTRSSTLTVIFDIRFSHKSQGEEYVEGVSAFIKTHVDGGLDRFIFTYDEETQVGCFTLVGEVNAVKKIMEVLK